MKISSPRLSEPNSPRLRPGLAQVGQRAVEVAVVLPQQRAHRQRGGQAPAVAGPAEGVERGGHVGADLVEVALVLGERGPEHVGQPGQPDVGAVDEALHDRERRLVLPQEVQRDRGQDAGESGQRRVGEQPVGQGPQRGLVLVQALDGQPGAGVDPVEQEHRLGAVALQRGPAAGSASASPSQ